MKAAARDGSEARRGRRLGGVGSLWDDCATVMLAKSGHHDIYKYHVEYGAW